MTFEFPKKDFVWDLQKIDSRPYKLGPVLHYFFEHGEIFLDLLVGVVWSPVGEW